MCVALSNIHTGYRTTIVETVKWIPNNEMLFADSYGTTTLGGMENKSFENEKLEGNKEESAGGTFLLQTQCSSEELAPM